MKRIQAYFQNENDAEDAKTSVSTLKVENVSVERIPENHNRIEDIIKKIIEPNKNGGHSPQVLQFDVAEEDYPEADKIVKESRGHISME
ncbi:hypothetical protein [Sediminibacillus massiliensis]|uniref:hypothetical protein n=1 Tax=Sediminibacillus massiliensis TaxID=1926277 RepID=UPI0009883746|nr:hypothetical protein [Sediminibacillus massiliensis]